MVKSYGVVVVVAPGIILSALGLFRFSILDSQSQSQSQSLDNNFPFPHLLFVPGTGTKRHA